MYKTNYDFAVNHEIQDFACTINGKEYKGYYSPDRIPTAEVPAGYYKYEARTCDTCAKLATIEPRVVVNFGGSILLKDNIDFNDSAYLDFDDFTINDAYYQEFPQILKVHNEANDNERKLIVEAVGGENNFKERVDNANEYHAFKLNLTYEEADDLVFRLNKPYDDNDMDTPWYLGDCHEIYVEVD